MKSDDATVFRLYPYQSSKPKSTHLPHNPVLALNALLSLNPFFSPHPLNFR